MYSFLTAPQNMPFSIAIVVMFLITILEMVSLSFGAGLSDLIDSILPEFDAEVDFDVEIEADADVDVPDASPASIAKVLSWFRIGEVPVLMLFIVFLTVFGVYGLILQSLVSFFAGFLLPRFVAAVPVFIISLPSIRFIGGIMAKYMPKDETYAISEKSLIGRVATIIAGNATQGHPVQAKLKDEHGQTHYILVEPDKADEILGKGNKVVLVSQVGAVFKAIESRSTVFDDE